MRKRFHLHELDVEISKSQEEFTRNSVLENSLSKKPQGTLKNLKIPTPFSLLLLIDLNPGKCW